MTLRHLKIFTEVYQNQSMSIAAQNLYMTQPSVSQAIKELETHYHAILFERLSKKLYITEDGKKLYQYARQIIDLSEQAENEFSQENKTQTLHIGVNYTVGLSMIHTFLHEFKKQKPDVEVHICVNKASMIKDMLRTSQLDLALLESSGSEKDFIQKAFADDRIVLVATPEHPLANSANVTAARLSKEHFLTREKGVGARELFEKMMLASGYPITPYWESISVTALLNAVYEGEGIAVLPYESVKHLLQEGKLVEISIQGLNLSRQLVIMYHKNKQFTPEFNSFIQCCLNTSLDS